MPPTPPRLPPPPAATAKQMARLAHERDFRRARRRARAKAEEVSELTIPLSSTQVQPQDNINVTISMREVAVNDRRAVATANGVIPAAAKEGGKPEAFYVGAVYDALKKEVEKQ